MISTLYLIQFAAFYLWQVTSSSNKRSVTTGLAAYAVKNKLQARSLSGLLLLAALGGFIFNWGVASGIIGFMVGLMGVGCLSVVIDSFNYLRMPGVAAIYMCCVLLEMTI